MIRQPGNDERAHDQRVAIRDHQADILGGVQD